MKFSPFFILKFKFVDIHRLLNPKDETGLLSSHQNDLKDEQSFNETGFKMLLK
jgi:hypothetical protein